MRRTLTLLVWLPVAAALIWAGPPANSHASSGGAPGGGGGGRPAPAGNYGVAPAHPHFSRAPFSIAGPLPLGASGPAPLNATGSLFPSRNPTGADGGGRRGGEANRVPVNRHPNRNFYAFYPFPYASYGGYDNGYYDSGDYGATPEYNSDNGDTQQVLMNQDALGQQVQQLTAEIEDMKSQQQQQQPPAALQPPPSISSSNTARAADADTQNDIPVTLVLRSGQQLTVKNYAVTKGMFWDFSKQPAQKIPLSSIDVAASTKTTEANGGEFPPLAQ